MGHQNACSCGCDGPDVFKPRFITQKQKIAKLEKYLGDLRDEVQAVEEHLAQIMKEL
jgi:hypothetical protein